MAKSQKNPVIISEKSQIKPAKGVDKPSAKKEKPIAIQASEKSSSDSKQSMIQALLKRPIGATIDEIAKAIGWQQHSVRGLMSGVLRKKLGLTIASGTEERGRVYRITGSVSRL